MVFYPSETHNKRRVNVQTKLASVGKSFCRTKAKTLFIYDNNTWLFLKFSTTRNPINFMFTVKTISLNCKYFFTRRTWRPKRFKCPQWLTRRGFLFRHNRQSRFICTDVEIHQEMDKEDVLQLLQRTRVETECDDHHRLWRTLKCHFQMAGISYSGRLWDIHLHKLQGKYRGANLWT